MPPPPPPCSILTPVLHDDNDDDDSDHDKDDDDQALKGGQGRAVEVNLFHREKLLLQPHGHLDHHYHYDNGGDGDGDDDDAPVEKDSLGEDFLHSMSGFCVVLLRSVWDLIFMMTIKMMVMMVIL